MPYISSSGKERPQSMIRISSIYSNTVMFFPISFIPPMGMIFREAVSFSCECSFMLISFYGFTTILTSLPGTAMTFTTVIPAIRILIFSFASALSSNSFGEIAVGT